MLHARVASISSVVKRTAFWFFFLEGKEDYGQRTIDVRVKVAESWGQNDEDVKQARLPNVECFYRVRGVADH